MQTLARTLPALFVLMLGCLSPQAVAQGESLPSAESLFEGHITAMGGREALEQHRNRLLHGVYTVVATGETKILTIAQEAPDKIRADIDTPAIGSSARVCDGTNAWGINNNGSPFEVTGREKLELIDSSFFNGEGDYKESYASYQTVGTTTIDERSVYRVDFTTHTGLSGAVFFDQDTGLVTARQVFPATRADPQSMVVVRDYEEFEGVKLPTKQIQLMGDRLEPAVEIDFRWVEINADEMPQFSPPESLLAAQQPESE